MKIFPKEVKQILFILVLGAMLITATGGQLALAATYDCSVQTSIPQIECEALVALYNNTGGDTWGTNEFWMVGGDPCVWFGIECSGGSVTRITLVDNQLSGSIPAEIGDLINLQWIMMLNNQLNGSIPAELGNLTNLQHLYLRNNILSGSIPPELGNLNNLLHLQLATNSLTGIIPPQLGNLTNLTHLDLQENSLSGIIPVELGSLANLQTLWMKNNLLSGSIPSELGNLTNLFQLKLGNNLLDGIIPIELGNLAKLASLELFQNDLNGTIPVELSYLTNLTNLDLATNSLSGIIPAELGYLTKLTHLGLHENNLSGNIPTQLGNLVNLSTLSLAKNNLSGIIPVELGYLSNLSTLWLFFNNLTGNIPSELGKLTNLVELALFNNSLSGSIPADLGNLSYLNTLWMHNNNLNGNIPTQLGNLVNLKTFLLYGNNNLTGALPASLANLVNLDYFRISTTNLCEPQDSTFQTWLGGIDTYIGSGIDCLPTLILVHGFQGLANLDGNPNTNGYHCNEGIQEYDPDNPDHQYYLGSMPDWFVSEGFKVWIAHLETSPSGTPSLEFNAECLRDQVEYVASVNPNPITIVAHSMGGVVSRAAIGYVDAEKINALYTLGSPHAGVPVGVFSGPLIMASQIGASNMSNSYMRSVFNPSHENIKGIDYYFIGGDGGGSLDLFLKLNLQGPNDGLIGKYSAVGWVYPFTYFVPDWTGSTYPGQYWTDEIHSARSTGSDFAYYEERSGGYSHAFQCIIDLMEDGILTTDKCEQAVVATQASVQSDVEAATTSISSISQIETGSLGDGGSISIPIQIDTAGETLFNLSWSSGDFELTLTRPDAQIIDPAYAVANPSEVTYEAWVGSPESYPSKGYYFSNAMAGEWQLNITATSAGDYWAYAMLTSPYTLDASTDHDSYAMGDTATITATLEKNAVGLSGQTVTATLTNQDGSVATVALTDQSDGTYTNTYLIPIIPGYLRISIDADGDDAGTLFTRHTSLQVTVQPEDADFTGTYGEMGDDTNLDGLYEILDFEIEIDATNAGEYALSADLYAGSEFIAHTGDFFTLASGIQSVSLSFNGTTIRNAGLNGPYTITNVFLIPLDLGLLTASADDVLATTAYGYAEFGICYALTLNHSGNGSDPIPTPANSTRCASGEYVEGEVISLTAAPDSGWKVDSWSGTDNDTSVALTNAVTMPLSDHSLSVNYSDIPPAVSSIMRIDTNPTSASSVDFTVTFTEPVTGVDTTAPFDDFALTTTGDLTGASFSAVFGSGDTYVVTVNTGSGDGAIRLDVIDDDSIIDADSNPLGGTGLGNGDFTSGESYAVEKAAISDFDGDGISDPAKFYPSNGVVWWLKSSTSLWDSVWLGPETFDYVPRSDFDGDGISDPGKFNSAAGTVWYIKSGDSAWEGQYLGVDSYTYHEGADFDGDGKTDPTKLIPNGAIWYIKSSTDTWEGFWLGPEVFEYVTGDFDGDGKNDPAKFVANPGVLWYWASSTSGWVGIFLGSDAYEYVSSSDFDGDGKTDPAKFYAATGTVWWLKSSTGLWDAAWMGPGTFDFIGGNDFDGDGKTDPAMYDPATGILSWLKSSTGTWDSADMGLDTYELVN